MKRGAPIAAVITVLVVVAAVGALATGVGSSSSATDSATGTWPEWGGGPPSSAGAPALGEPLSAVPPPNAAVSPNGVAPWSGSAPGGSAPGQGSVNQFALADPAPGGLPGGAFAGPNGGAASTGTMNPTGGLGPHPIAPIWDAPAANGIGLLPPQQPSGGLPGSATTPALAVPGQVAPAASPLAIGAGSGGAANTLGAHWGQPPAPGVDPRVFTEAHWQGLEVIPKTPQLAEALGLPADVAGVIIDDVTLPADLQGFKAGDLVTHIGTDATPDLLAFIRATETARDQQQASIGVVRDGERSALVLVGLGSRLGNANGETPSMIPPGARAPHAYRGPCTSCHRIGFTGQLPIDQGDLANRAAPTIRSGATQPHRDRGACASCHQIVP